MFFSMISTRWQYRAIFFLALFFTLPGPGWRRNDLVCPPVIPTDLLLGPIPQCSVDGVSSDICPVDIAVFGIPVQCHGIAYVSQRDDIIRHVLGVKADTSDVRPSGKKQELVKT